MRKCFRHYFYITSPHTVANNLHDRCMRKDKTNEKQPQRFKEKVLQKCLKPAEVGKVLGTFTEVKDAIKQLRNTFYFIKEVPSARCENPKGLFSYVFLFIYLNRYIHKSTYIFKIYILWILLFRFGQSIIMYNKV